MKTPFACWTAALCLLVSTAHGASGAHGGLAADTPLWSVASAIALVTLTALEIVLGIDNVIFIAIIAGRLPEEQRNKARVTGIAVAVITRILLLFSISWLMGLTTPLWPAGPAFLAHLTGKGLILLLGGLFLVGKSVSELHEKLEAAEHAHAVNTTAAKAASFLSVVAQIMLIDVVFSLDSVITAVGMSSQLPVMVAAVLMAALVMIVFQRAISDFVEKHPTMKVLALSFLILIGVMLVAEAFGHHIPKGYIYFSMAFALLIELFNLAVRSKSERVKLHYSTLPQRHATHEHESR